MTAGLRRWGRVLQPPGPEETLSIPPLGEPPVTLCLARGGRHYRFCFS